MMHMYVMPLSPDERCHVASVSLRLTDFGFSITARQHGFLAGRGNTADPGRNSKATCPVVHQAAVHHHDASQRQGVGRLYMLHPRERSRAALLDDL